MSRIIVRDGKVSPLGVNCPWCGAVVGKSCQTSSGKRLHGTHQGRKDVAQEVWPSNPSIADMVAGGMVNAADADKVERARNADAASDALADTAANNKQLHWTS